MSAPNIIFNVKYTRTEKDILSSRVVNKKHLANRDYYSCKQTNDFLKYVNDGIKMGDVVGYTGNNEKSSGVFNQDGKLTKAQQKALRQQLRKTDSIIWHTIISFSEEFGARYMKSDDDALDLLRAELPKFLKRAGFAEDNVVWFAGLHENTDNQHIHLAFFEKEPIYISARNKEVKKFRNGKIPKYAIDSFIVHAEERLTNAGFDLKRSRRELIGASSQALSSGFERDLKKRLLELYRAMPTEGRISYDSLNMAGLRPHVRGIVDYMVKNNPSVKVQYQKFCTELVKKDSNMRDTCLRSNINYIPYLVEDKYLEDVYRRLGDKVIKAALVIKAKEEKAKRGCRSYRAKKRVERRHRLYLYDRTNSLTEDVNNDALKVFDEYIRKLGVAEHNRLIEEGAIEVE